MSDFTAVDDVLEAQLQCAWSTSMVLGAATLVPGVVSSFLVIVLMLSMGVTGPAYCWVISVIIPWLFSMAWAWWVHRTVYYKLEKPHSTLMQYVLDISGETAWGYIEHVPHTCTGIVPKEIHALTNVADAVRDRVLELLQLAVVDGCNGNLEEEADTFFGPARRQGRACIFEEDDSMEPATPALAENSLAMSQSAAMPRFDARGSAEMLCISPVDAALSLSHLPGRSRRRRGSVSATSPLIRAESESATTWKTGDAMYLAVKIRYTEPLDIPLLHQGVFESIKEVARAYGGKLEWSGGTETVLYWAGNDDTFIRVVSCAKGLCTMFATTCCAKYVWGCGIGCGESRFGSIRSKSRLVQACVISSSKDEALELARLATDISASVLMYERPHSQASYAEKESGFGPIAEIKNNNDGFATTRTLFCLVKDAQVSVLADINVAIKRHDHRGAAALLEGLMSLPSTDRVGIPVDWMHKNVQDTTTTFGMSRGNSLIHKTVALSRTASVLGLTRHHTNDSLAEQIRASLPIQSVIRKARYGSVTRDPDTQARSLSLNNSPRGLSNSDDLGASAEEVSVEGQSSSPDAELEKFAAVFSDHISNTLLTTVKSGCFSTVSNVFSGHSVVVWLVSTFEVCPDTAVAISEILRSRGLFESVHTKVKVFVNDNEVFYRFRASTLEVALEKLSDTKEEHWVGGALQKLVHDIEADEELKTCQARAKEDKKKAQTTRVKRLTVVSKNEMQEAEDRRRAIRNRDKNIWTAAKLLVLIFNAVSIPLHVAFDVPFTLWVAILQWVADVCVYWVTILVTARLNPNYLKSQAFLLSLVACFPVECLAVIWDPAYLWKPHFRLNRLLHLTSFNDLFGEFVGVHLTSVSPIKLQALKLLMFCLFLVHMSSSALHLVLWTSHLADVDSGNRYMGIRDFNNEDLAVRYFACLDWAVRAMSGYGCRWPISDPQNIVVGVVQMMGVAVWATVIAYVAVLLDSTDPAKKEYEKLSEQLRVVLRERNLPEPFRNEVAGYIKFLWETTRMHHVGQYDFLMDSDPLTSDALMWGLPSELRSAFAYHMNEHVLDSIPLLKNEANDNFVADVVSKLRLRVYTPSSEIIAQYDEGNNFYMIVRGTVSVSRDGVHVATLSEGSFFGELSLLYGVRSPYSVTAKTYCQLYVLNQQGFVWAAENYPHCLQVCHLSTSYYSICRKCWRVPTKGSSST
eukprot:TRINITY_DN1397_c1_g2_i2.p1 TRINITY_DN1397_c1_g2~~TRINITY_DN1397_c1_g2_i2.p1  ORF type:complete len:1201 (+),score=357.40 TRINITY_DN1397_c1_g2_i2:60-3662(+)